MWKHVDMKAQTTVTSKAQTRAQNGKAKSNAKTRTKKKDTYYHIGRRRNTVQHRNEPTRITMVQLTVIIIIIITCNTFRRMAETKKKKHEQKKEVEDGSVSPHRQHVLKWPRPKCGPGPKWAGDNSQTGQGPNGLQYVKVRAQMGWPKSLSAPNCAEPVLETRFLWGGTLQIFRCKMMEAFCNSFLIFQVI